MIRIANADTREVARPVLPLAPKEGKVASWSEPGFTCWLALLLASTVKSFVPTYTMSAPPMEGEPVVYTWSSLGAVAGYAEVLLRMIVLCELLGFSQVKSSLLLEMAAANFVILFFMIMFLM